MTGFPFLSLKHPACGSAVQSLPQAGLTSAPLEAPVCDSTFSRAQSGPFRFRPGVADHDGRRIAVLYCVSCDIYRRQVRDDAESTIATLTSPQDLPAAATAAAAHVCPPAVRRA